MNKFLASALSVGNALIAWGIILASAAWGGIYFEGIVGFLGGLIVGFIASVVVCGSLALFIDIRKSVHELCGFALRSEKQLQDVLERLYERDVRAPLDKKER